MRVKQMRSHHAVALAGLIATALWLISHAAPVWSGESAQWTFRASVLVLALITTVLLVSGPNRLAVLTPLSILALVAIVLHSTIPGLYATFLLGRFERFANDVKTAAFVGGDAELAILRFGLLAIVGTCCLVAIHLRSRRFAARPLLPPASRLFPVAPAVLGIVASVLYYFRDVPLMDGTWGGPMMAGVMTMVRASPPAIVSFCLASLAVMAYGGVKWSLWLLVFVVALTFSLTLGGMTKQVVIVVMVLGGLVALAPRISGLAVIGTLAATLLVGFAGVTHLRYQVAAVLLPEISEFYRRAYLGQGFNTYHFLVMKVVHRQAENGYCLDSVMKRHLDAPPSSHPLYFVSGLVPRAVWPDKPSLSRGNHFAVQYCGYTEGPSSNPEWSHSASITLLGEPIVTAGRIGLATAQLVLLVGLALVGHVMLRGGTWSLVTVTALAPWLLDFDQHFALYVANATKMFVFMVPLLLLARYIDRRAVGGVADRVSPA